MMDNVIETRRADALLFWQLTAMDKTRSEQRQYAYHMRGGIHIPGLP